MRQTVCIGSRHARAVAGLVLLLLAATVPAPSTGRADKANQTTPSRPSYRTRNVFVVSIDGLRSAEAFDAEDPSARIPVMWNRLRPQGSLYRSFYNLGATWTTPGNHTIVDGCWEMTPNSEGLRYFRPHCPTMFEYYRNANPEMPEEKVWAILGKSNCDLSHYSWHPLFGESHAASLVPSVGSDRWDRAAWSDLKRVIVDHHPSLVFLHLGEVDHAGHTEWGWYLEAILDADRIVGELWDLVQSDPEYRDQTTLLVTTDHGRHDDEHGGFKSHGGISEGDKRLFLLAIGPDIKAGVEFTDLRQQTDICPTVGELLSFDTPLAAGTVMGEMIVGYAGPSLNTSTAQSAGVTWEHEAPVTRSPGIVEQPDIAVDSAGVHVVWVDDRSGNREVFHKLRAIGSTTWTEALQISASDVEARAPSVASDGSTLHVVWQDYATGNWTILYRQRTISGTWSATTVVAESLVEVGSDPGERCEMVMEPEVVAAQGEVWVAVPLMADRLRLYRRNVDGSWQGTTIVDAPASEHVPGYSKLLPQRVALAATDVHTMVFWQEVKRLDWILQHSSSWNSVGSWGQPERFTFRQGDHSITAAGDATSMHTAWIHSEYAVPPHSLWYTRKQSGGQPWQSPTLVKSDDCWNPELAAAAGTVALVWEDYRGNVPAIYLGQSTDDGLTWDEQKVSHGDDFAVNPAVATDGQSIYVVWRDRRDGTWELYLSQVSNVEPAPTASPTATVTATPTATATVTRTETRTATLIASPTAEPTVMPTPTQPVYEVYLPLVLKGY